MAALRRSGTFLEQNDTCGSWEYGLFEITHADGMIEIPRLDDVGADHEP
jgi:hypothetical protein